SDQSHPRTDACDHRAAFVPAAQPRQHGSISLHDVIEAWPGSGNEYQVGFAYIVKRHRRPNLDSAIRADRAAANGGGSHAKTGSRLGTGEAVPERASVAEHLHGPKCSRSESIVDKQNCDVDHVAS